MSNAETRPGVPAHCANCKEDVMPVYVETMRGYVARCPVCQHRI